MVCSLRVFSLILFILLALYSVGCGGGAGNGNEVIDGDDGDDGDDDGDGSDSSCAEPSSNHPWPMFRGNRNHSGFANVTGPSSANNIKWTSNGTREANSIALSDDGVLYVAALDGLHALKSSDGSEMWSNTTFTNAQGPAISEDGGTIFFVSESTSDVGTIVAVNSSGTKLWTRDTGNKAIFGPTLGSDGTVYQGSWDKIFYALDPSTGAIKWQYTTDGCASYPASLDPDGHVYLGGGDANCLGGQGKDGNVYSFNATDGSLRWKTDSGADRNGTPAIGHDCLLIIPASPDLVALSAAGEEGWTLDEQTGEVTGVLSPAIGPDGTIYTVNSKGEFRAVDPSTHEVKWKYDTGTGEGLITFPVVDKNGTVYACTTGGTMYAVDKDGNKLWSYESPNNAECTEASPAFGSDGTLYYATDDGDVHAISP